jgi:branched-chain amino acid transport system permease protein
MGLKALPLPCWGIGNPPGAVLGDTPFRFSRRLQRSVYLVHLTRAVVFAILILVLVFRPWGFLGQPPPSATDASLLAGASATSAVSGPCSRGIGALLLFPFVDLMCNLQLLNAVTDAAVFVVLALGLNIVVGYAGLLDLGYAAFFAIGAYTTGILTWPPHGLELNFWWAMLLSVPVAALFGVILGAPTLRVRGDYLAIITLAFGEIVPIAFRNLWHIDIRIGGWTLVENFNLTNGPQGMNPVGRPHLFGYEFSFEPLPWYFLILAIGFLVIMVKSRLEHSRLGRAWMAIREDEVAADCMGVDPIKTKS